MASDFFLRENKRNLFFLLFFFGGGSTCSFSAEAVNLSAEVTRFSASISAGAPDFSIVAICLLVGSGVFDFSAELICFFAETVDAFSTEIAFSVDVACFSEDAKGFREEASCCFSEIAMDFWEEVDDVAMDTDFLSKLACFSEEVDGLGEDVNDFSVDLTFSLEAMCFSVEVGFLLKEDVSVEVTAPVADFFIETVDFSWEDLATVGFLAFESSSAPVGRVTGWLSWNSS